MQEQNDRTIRTTFLQTWLKFLYSHTSTLHKKNASIEIILIVAKVPDDILIGGSPRAQESFIKELGKHYKIGIVVHTPGSFLFFGLTITQDENFRIQLSCEDKLE